MFRGWSLIETLVLLAIVPPSKTKAVASTARCMMGGRILRVMLMMSSSCWERRGKETVDAEIADAGLRAAIDDQLRHDGSGTGTELEAMQRKPELMVQALVNGAGAKHRQIVLCPGFNSGPGQGGATHRRSSRGQLQCTLRSCIAMA